MDDLKKLEFLKALAEAGDSANMWTAGEAVGLEHNAIENLGVELMNQGYLEMASLSGGVRLTDKGSEELAGADGAEKAPDLEQMLQRIVDAGLDLGPGANANLTADIATLRAALKRSHPLAPVVKACMAAIDAALQMAGAPGEKLRPQLAALKPQ
ncbi:MAG: hypothetical protein K9K66_02595 [Desulfarculaceae bacterium]|nr:hypothetical protein [Desulfarculaceae bacterium]MCF8070938.1 hypothetical protein [Desulfarculaceae bacterium]MCF8100526.1 hypothetical protein [Desulfarculaceae bacterium]MCF8116552.1 hypothetical protein [Desulfarculaceae bacterium]